MAAAAASTGPVYTDITCQLEALPKKGDINGSARSSAGGNVGGVAVVLTDAKGRKHRATSGPGGSFNFKGLPLGRAKVRAEHKDYLLYTSSIKVLPRKKVSLVLNLTKRPRRANVRIIGRQIRISRKIPFELNSATLKGDAFSLLAEIADVINRNAKISKIEIQGHTDNTGSPAGNKRLSQNRANTVQRWLVEHGISSSRLVAKGFGQARPIAPNVTPANRARNRRVQFVILKKN